MTTRNLVIKVIIMTQKTDRVTDWKRKKNLLEQETGQIYIYKKYFIESNKHCTENN